MATHQDRIVIVTGAGSGIGRATALRLSQEGARVALLGRRKELLDQVAAETSGEALVFTCDIRDRIALDEVCENIKQTWGAPAALVANAGVGGPNEEGPEDRWDEVVRTNLDGTYFSIRAFERVMDQVATLRNVVVISSCLARFGVPGYTAYCASKAGLLGMVRAFAMEWAEQGTVISGVCPGWVETEMARAGMQGIADATGQSYEAARKEAIDLVPAKRISEPEEIAALVSFLLTPEARAFTGQTLDPNNGAWMA